jgi:hypothetical protein
LLQFLGVPLQLVDLSAGDKQALIAFLKTL